tara:strand:- start:1135 stop:1290 length:156 start_codon:yes stop_codon:yes gene_type:complete
MVWTAIFSDQKVEVFSTQYNSYEEAEEKAWELWSSPLFAIIKGNHPDVKFF